MRPEIGATVEECTQNYYNLVTELGDSDRRRIHSYRSECEDWHGVAKCDKACVRHGLKGKETYWSRAAVAREVQRAAAKLKRPAAAVEAAGRSWIKMESRVQAAAAGAVRSHAGAGVWRKLERPYGLGALE
ncbi:MAG: hypothetical protein M1826_006911 [Phylliscum demangeonii]|nr:MAG: hypothetical protein M1826_006911 [Phylliscum demangeonii]